MDSLFRCFRNHPLCWASRLYGINANRNQCVTQGISSPVFTIRDWNLFMIQIYISQHFYSKRADDVDLFFHSRYERERMMGGVAYYYRALWIGQKPHFCVVVGRIKIKTHVHNFEHSVVSFRLHTHTFSVEFEFNRHFPPSRSWSWDFPSFCP